MERWPTLERILPRRIRDKPGQEVGTDAGDVNEAFLTSGGSSFFITATGFDPRDAGVQLVTSVFVPRGKIGFVKQITIAPFMPTVFSDPWHAEGVLSPPPVGQVPTSWRVFNATIPFLPIRPGGQLGVWETPFGWENYFDANDPLAVVPQWVWHLKLIQGPLSDIQKLPFSTAVPASWTLQPNVAVPASAYTSGIPGNAPGIEWGAQRMQVIQGDKLVSHVVVPENTTVCLFAQWTQAPTPVLALDTAGNIIHYQSAAGEGAGNERPLLPSFGQLHGYMQATDRKSTTHNARFGWGG